MNNRAKLLWLVVVWMALLLTVAEAAKAYDPAQLAPTTVCKTTSSTQMLCLHNYTRKVLGLPLLKGAKPLYTAAAEKTALMVQCNQFSHTPCGTPPFQFFPPTFFMGAVGENAAYGYPTIRQTYTAWLDSPGHYTNIVNPAFRCYGSNRLLAPTLPFLWVTDFSGTGC